GVQGVAHPSGTEQRLKLAALDVSATAIGQTVPSGVSRINDTARINGTDQRVNVNVAILDSGIDTTHPDLHVAGGVNCSSQVTGWNPPYLDGNGHGTYVAGIVGALDNSSGVVGVAPGANLWAVR